MPQEEIGSLGLAVKFEANDFVQADIESQLQEEGDVNEKKEDKKSTKADWWEELEDL